MSLNFSMGHMVAYRGSRTPVERSGSETWPGQCVVFFGKTLFSQSKY